MSQVLLDDPKTADDPKTQLAFAIATGVPTADWAEENGVARSTAFRWAKEPEVRKIVNAWRRESLDAAIGRLAGRAGKAADGITGLAETAESESVRLRAWRSILSDQITVAKFSDLEDRVQQMEEQVGLRSSAGGLAARVG